MKVDKKLILATVPYVVIFIIAMQPLLDCPSSFFELQPSPIGLSAIKLGIDCSLRGFPCCAALFFAHVTSLRKSYRLDCGSKNEIMRQAGGA
jgi:hypothetical protein